MVRLSLLALPLSAALSFREELSRLLDRNIIEAIWLLSLA
jgi:hypothetical protein